jgi:hypothetical protein
MTKRYVIAAAALALTIGVTHESLAGRRQAYSYSNPCYCRPVSPAAPSMTPVPAAPAPPTTGETHQSASVEPQPEAAPPAAPSTGSTYRSYSYQPAPVYSYQPSISGRASSLRDNRPQDEVINRKLHPGTYKFEN